MLSRRTVVASALAGTAATLTATRAGAAIASITFSTAVDYTGPFADVMPSWHSGHRAMAAWWNDTEGKRLGAEVVLKVHDMRYNTGVVAQSWPGILASEKPAMYLGMGTPDLIALMKRLPSDKVPMIMPTAMLGLVWKPNGWGFTFRPTYSHEFAALFAYLQTRLPDKRALRIATVSTKGRAGYEDQVNGIVHLTRLYPDRFKIADQQWVADNPVDATDQVRRMGAEKPDVVMIGATTAQVVSVAKARKDLGLSFPIASSSHNGITETQKVIPLADLEGDFSVFSFAPYNQPGLPAAAAYEKYHTAPGSWGIVAAQAAAQTVLACRILEAAIGKVGVAKADGQALYDAILGNPYTEAAMLGLTATLRYDTSRPFPIGEVKAKALTVRNGAIVPLTQDWMPCPELSKW